MSEIEKMKRYIARTNARKDIYQMNLREAMDMACAATKTPVEMIYLAFEYGKAKGYRAAKAEVRA